MPSMTCAPDRPADRSSQRPGRPRPTGEQAQPLTLGAQPLTSPPTAGVGQLPAAGASAAPAASTHAHGTEARYKHGPDEYDVPGKGCRCTHCRRAKRERANHRARMKAYGRWQPFVPAGPAREWVLMLMDYGIGWQRIAALAGLTERPISKLLYGRPPSGKIRPETEAKILAVKPVLANLADTTLVDPAGTRRRLQALVAVGWPQRRLARRLGWAWNQFHAVMYHQNHVSAKTARTVIALYEQLWDQPPSQATPTERTAVIKARQLAELRHWPPPQAWDDEAIDDPRATAADYQRKARLSQAALIEEAEELFRVHGLDRNLAAERLGVTRACLDKAISREATARARAHAAAAARARRRMPAARTDRRRHRTRPARPAARPRRHIPDRQRPAAAASARRQYQRPRGPYACHPAQMASVMARMTPFMSGTAVRPARRAQIRHRAGDNAVLITTTPGGEPSP